MIWRTCGSLSALVGTQRVLDAGRGVRGAGRHEAEVLRVSASSRSSRRPRASLVAVPEGRHPVAADQAGDRGVVDAGLLRQLALRHLLGLELGSQPFVERSAVLRSSWSHWAPLVLPPVRRGHMQYPSRSVGAYITRWYSRVGRSARDHAVAVWCGRGPVRGVTPSGRPWSGHRDRRSAARAGDGAASKRA